MTKIKSRKKFIVSHGGHCPNWTWAWSFINESKRLIIFGAWSNHPSPDYDGCILDKAWAISYKGNKQPAYPFSREHIRLIEVAAYRLAVFPMEYSMDNKGENGIGPAKIESFTPVLTAAKLQRINDRWYARLELPC